ncbi:MAG: Glycosyl hydrolase family 16 [Candidatus Magasanikbacteria bacterium GW2011_GWC2_37_14]|uniref:Glycosyl hydrolase family 16 n=1 Tax=Candidatus Magasanikbacteria bacterium GW2011_GWC2_37_14 TaxID=1619046 RepID=A0A0G0GD13_9BACT|nr:MAG: Glycosyl hydrolase family 16 [Candidatus Magasanikbacteria bacterium GW2011_GWC2_37_14]
MAKNSQQFNKKLTIKPGLINNTAKSVAETAEPDIEKEIRKIAEQVAEEETKKIVEQATMTDAIKNAALIQAVGNELGEEEAVSAIENLGLEEPELVPEGDLIAEAPKTTTPTDETESAEDEGTALAPTTTGAQQKPTGPKSTNKTGNIATPTQAAGSNPAGNNDDNSGGNEDDTNGTNAPEPTDSGIPQNPPTPPIAENPDLPPPIEPKTAPTEKPVEQNPETTPETAPSKQPASPDNKTAPTNQDDTGEKPTDTAPSMPTENGEADTQTGLPNQDTANDAKSTGANQNQNGDGTSQPEGNGEDGKPQEDPQEKIKQRSGFTQMINAQRNREKIQPLEGISEQLTNQKSSLIGQRKREYNRLNKPLQDKLDVLKKKKRKLRGIIIVLIFICLPLVWRFYPKYRKINKEIKEVNTEIKNIAKEKSISNIDKQVKNIEKQIKETSLQINKLYNASLFRNKTQK